MAYDPLSGAFARVKRADEHIAHIRAISFDLQQICLDGVTLEFDPNRPNEAPQPRIYHLATPPALLGILIGETIYNLRAALDYLAHELAILDSRAVQKTQFPIKDKSTDFWKRGKCVSLPGVNDAHIAAIERLQPYEGCKWTKLLRDFSNPDKHREITLAQGSFSLSVYDPDRLRFLDMPRMIKSAKNPVTGDEVQMMLSANFEIQFTDGLPVLASLNDIKTQVALTLESFRPGFK